MTAVEASDRNYARCGPLEDVMASTSRDRVGVIGLGAGASRPTESRAAPHLLRDRPRDPGHRHDAGPFTFLRDSEGRGRRRRSGTGGSSSTDEPEAEFDLTVLHAFSSDAIPVDLLTREAMRHTPRTWLRGGSRRSTSATACSTWSWCSQATADDLAGEPSIGTGTGDADEDAIEQRVVITPDAPSRTKSAPAPDGRRWSRRRRTCGSMTTRRRCPRCAERRAAPTAPTGCPTRRSGRWRCRRGPRCAPDR